MKTAISLPDDTFDRASRRAKDLGVSRSEFFSQAASRYLDELDEQSVTEQINDALTRAGSVDDSQEAAVEVGRQVLQGDSSSW